MEAFGFCEIYIIEGCRVRWCVTVRWRRKLPKFAYFGRLRALSLGVCWQREWKWPIGEKKKLLFSACGDEMRCENGMTESVCDVCCACGLRRRNSPDAGSQAKVFCRHECLWLFWWRAEFSSGGPVWRCPCPPSPPRPTGRPAPPSCSPAATFQGRTPPAAESAATLPASPEIQYIFTPLQWQIHFSPPTRLKIYDPKGGLHVKSQCSAAGWSRLCFFVQQREAELVFSMKCRAW